MFVGYPRSGHSLVGSLLDAHPDAVIAHELDALRYVRAGFSRDQVFALILDKDREFSRQGRQAKVDYTYVVPGQWQGRYRELVVIGDKKGGHSTAALAGHPPLLDRLRSRVGVPLRLVHVTRNPYDNIATIFTRSPKADLGAAVEHYLSLRRGMEGIRRRLAPGELLDLRYESLLEDPAPQLERLCAFAGLEVPPDYTSACAAVLRPPRPTRHQAPWTSDLRRRVDREVAAGADLSGYAFE